MKIPLQFQLDWTKIFKKFTPNIEKNLLILISFLYRREIDRALRKSAQTEKAEKGIVQTQLPLLFASSYCKSAFFIWDFNLLATPTSE